MQKLDPDDPRPQYVQVVESIRADVSSGALPLGKRLPSHAEMATDYGVSVGTIKRALGRLQEEGLVVSRQGQPAHIRAQPDPVRSTIDTSDVRAALIALDRRLADVEQRLSQVSP